MPESVLVLAPHPDDESIGCAGAILQHRLVGDHIRVIFLTSGEQGIPGRPASEVWGIREREALRAAQALGIHDFEFWRLADRALGREADRVVPRLRQVFQRRPPTRVYIPHPQDGHTDHEAVWPMVEAALQGLPEVAPTVSVLGYEVWNPIRQPGHVLDISRELRTKLRAIRCYESQLALVRYDQAVRGLNRYRGVLAGGGRYAEAFERLEVRNGLGSRGFAQGDT